ncbi:MAG: cupin domain-containing protein [Gaiellaceae bacterium]
MDTFNIYTQDQDWDGEQAHPGYRHRVTRVGGRLGAVGLGASLYELAPGESSWPYHYEHASEEWLLVVAGRPTLRTVDGEQSLEPGDVTVFPRGPAGAHKVTNATDERVRIVIFSTKTPVEVVAYPDSGKLGIWTLDDGYIAMVRNEPKLDYWQGE